MTTPEQLSVAPYTLDSINRYDVPETTDYQPGNEKSGLVAELSAVTFRIKKSEDWKLRRRVPNEIKKGVLECLDLPYSGLGVDRS